MEVIGAVASVAQLAATAYTLSKTLYEVGDTLSNASEDVRSLAHDLSLFSQSLIQLQRLLELNKSAYSVNVYLLTEKIIRDCTSIHNKIAKLIEKLAKTTTKARLQWLYKEKRVRELLRRLRDMKLTLLGILSTLQLDLQLSQLNINTESAIERGEKEKYINADASDFLEWRKAQEASATANKPPAKSKAFSRAYSNPDVFTQSYSVDVSGTTIDGNDDEDSRSVKTMASMRTFHTARSIQPPTSPQAEKLDPAKEQAWRLEMVTLAMSHLKMKEQDAKAWAENLDVPQVMNAQQKTGGFLQASLSETLELEDTASSGDDQIPGKAKKELASSRQSEPVLGTDTASKSPTWPSGSASKRLENDGAIILPERPASQTSPTTIPEYGLDPMSLPMSKHGSSVYKEHRRKSRNSTGKHEAAKPLTLDIFEDRCVPTGAPLLAKKKKKVPYASNSSDRIGSAGSSMFNSHRRTPDEYDGYSSSDQSSTVPAFPPVGQYSSFENSNGRKENVTFGKSPSEQASVDNVDELELYGYGSLEEGDLQYDMGYYEPSSPAFNQTGIAASGNEVKSGTSPAFSPVSPSYSPVSNPDIPVATPLNQKEFPTTLQLEQLWWRAFKELETMPADVISDGINDCFEDDDWVIRVKRMTGKINEQLLELQSQRKVDESAGVAMPWSKVYKILDIARTVEENLSFKTAVIGWYSLSMVITELLKQEQTSEKDPFEALFGIAGMIARYAVMENIYHQWEGMSLKKEYEEALIQLCIKILGYCAQASDLLRSGNWQSFFDKLDPLVAGIYEADAACRNFIIIVETVSDASDEISSSDDGSDSEVEYLPEVTTKRRKLVA